MADRINHFFHVGKQKPRAAAQSPSLSSVLLFRSMFTMLSGLLSCWSRGFSKLDGSDEEVEVVARRTLSSAIVVAFVFCRESHKLKSEEYDCFDKNNMKTVGISMLFNIIDTSCYVRVGHGYYSTSGRGEGLGKEPCHERSLWSESKRQQSRISVFHLKKIAGCFYCQKIRGREQGTR